MRITSGRSLCGLFDRASGVNGPLILNEWEKNLQKDLVMGPIWAGMISKLIDSTGVNHVLDYKCGENHPLSQHLTPQAPFKYQAYDKGIDEYSDDPVAADMVVSVGGLSELSSPEVDEALDEIMTLAQSVIFLTVATNRHPLEHWIPKIMDRFSLQRVQVAEVGSFCVVAFSLGL